MVFGRENAAASEVPHEIKCPISKDCGDYQENGKTCDFTGGMESEKPYCGNLRIYNKKKKMHRVK